MTRYLVLNLSCLSKFKHLCFQIKLVIHFALFTLLFAWWLWFALIFAIFRQLPVSKKCAFVFISWVRLLSFFSLADIFLWLLLIKSPLFYIFQPSALMMHPNIQWLDLVFVLSSHLPVACVSLYWTRDNFKGVDILQVIDNCELPWLTWGGTRDRFPIPLFLLHSYFKEIPPITCWWSFAPWWVLSSYWWSKESNYWQFDKKKTKNYKLVP